MFLSKLIGNKFKDKRLTSCSVSTGGGMLGGHREVTVKREEADDGTLTIRTREDHSAREVTTVYPVKAEVFDKLEEIVNRYDLYAASKRGMSDMQILDGDTTTIRFYYGRESFYVDELQDLNKTMSEGFRKVCQYMNSGLAVEGAEGVTTIEPQQGTLYLHGYTLQFEVAAAFDGRLDEILGTEREISRFEDCGIMLCTGETPDLTGAEPAESAERGNIYYDTASGSIILLYGEHSFSEPVYLLAKLDDYVDSACPLIEKMDGAYRLRLN